MARILGIDYGSKRVGLAVTDELQILSTPLDVYSNNAQLFENLLKLCREYKIGGIVIGYPYSETYQDAVRSVEQFGQKLQQYFRKNAFPVDIEFANEEFSSFFAENTLKTMKIKDKKIKASIDKFAAQKILEDYLKTREKEKQ
jgi:putative holliday junction resolvase